MAPVARRMVVSGRVQGVGYRDSCRRRAQQLEVSGWAANRADGSVEIHIEGEEPAVDAMVLWCRAGPRWAKVRDSTVADVALLGLTGFDVR